MDDKQLAIFDYGTLDLDTRSFVQASTAKIKELLTIYYKNTKSYEEIFLDISGILSITAVRIHNEILTLEWANAEFGFSASTCKQFMIFGDSFGILVRMINSLKKG
jgi:hypothetical protein